MSVFDVPGIRRVPRGGPAFELFPGQRMRTRARHCRLEPSAFSLADDYRHRLRTMELTSVLSTSCGGKLLCRADGAQNCRTFGGRQFVVGASLRPETRLRARSARSEGHEAASRQSDLLSRRIGRPNSEPHLTGTRGAFIDPDVGVACFGSWVDAGDAHFVTAMTSG